jgi:hypothetical protein
MLFRETRGTSVKSRDEESWWTTTPPDGFTATARQRTFRGHTERPE